MAEAYDVIIAGGGSSSCVAVTRLVRDHGARVLLIERGQRRQPWVMQLPAGYMKYLAREDYLEMHQTVPQPQLDGRAPIIPQARLLGGGSAVNAMVYMRGQREDYDGWDAFLGGGSGWSYADMLPHFRGMERNTRLRDEYHGIDGPLWISDPGQIHDMAEAYMLAVQGLGIRYTADFNGARQNGVGPMQHTIGRHRRSSAVAAFLSQVERDPRLTIATGALVTRILFEGSRAVGVEYEQQGRTVQARAQSEVLVATGTYNTAKLLMLSGLGPAAHLREHGIAVRADLPGVGQNLQDHHEVPVVSAARGRIGYYGQDRGWNMVRNGLQYLLTDSGPVTTTGVETCAFFDPDGGERPTIQMYFVPTVYLDRDVKDVRATHGCTITPCLLGARQRAPALCRSARQADGGQQFLRRSRRPTADHRGHAVRAPGAGGTAARGADRSRNAAGTRCRERRGIGGLREAHGQNQLPPGRHRAHGTGRRSDGGAGHAHARARRGRAAGDRLRLDSVHRIRQHQRDRARAGQQGGEFDAKLACGRGLCPFLGDEFLLRQLADQRFRQAVAEFDLLWHFDG